MRRRDSQCSHEQAPADAMVTTGRSSRRGRPGCCSRWPARSDFLQSDGRLIDQNFSTPKNVLTSSDKVIRAVRVDVAWSPCWREGDGNPSGCGISGPRADVHARSASVISRLSSPSLSSLWGIPVLILGRRSLASTHATRNTGAANATFSGGKSTGARCYMAEPAASRPISMP